MNYLRSLFSGAMLLVLVVHTMEDIVLISIGRFVPLPILCATIFSMFAAWLGYKMGATEILTAIVGGIFGFLGGVSLRIIENEGPESE